MKVLVFTTVLSLAAASSAQTSVHAPDNSATAGLANVIPFGNSKSSATWSNQRYQTLIPASFTSGKPLLIRDLAFAATTTNPHNFDAVQIRMGVTKNAKLSATFANNYDSSPTVVLDEKDYTWHLTSGQWVRIGITKPFLWIPQLGNLVIEVTTQGSGSASASRPTAGFLYDDKAQTPLERKYAIGWTGTPPSTAQTSFSPAGLKVELVITAADASIFGQSCQGSSGSPTLGYSGLPKPGSKISVDIANGPASGIAVLFLGFRAGSPLFPIDLTPAGAPTCKLYISPDIPSGLSLKGGAASSPLAIPAVQSLIGVQLWHQAFVFDKTANQLGLTATEFGRVLIGL